jgi:S1-C subfamily serine protease
MIFLAAFQEGTKNVNQKNHWMKTVVALPLLFVFAALVACASPKAVVRSQEPLPQYKKVYILAADPDPRSITPKVVSRMQSLGFEVVLKKKGEPIESQGSGFIISPEGHILTCAHVLGQEKNATVWIGENRYETELVEKDVDKDLALLKINNPSGARFKPLSLSQGPPLSMGQEVFIMGFPLTEILGKKPRLNKGLISATVGMKDDPDQLQISAEVQPGNSGGPLLNAQGAVIGIVASTMNPLAILRASGALPQNVNFAVKAEPIQAFLEKSGITSVQASEKNDPWLFDQVVESVVRVYGGIIPADRKPELICLFGYQSLWDLWYRFRVFIIKFYDKQSGKILLEAGQSGDNPFSTEDSILDKTFQEIQIKFSPEKKS